MAAVHFTTIPCEPNRAISTHRKLYFGEINPCTSKIVYVSFEIFRPFLYVFMSGFRIFVRYELWVNVPVAIFFRTVDSFPIVDKNQVDHVEITRSDGWRDSTNAKRSYTDQRVLTAI